MYVLDTKSGTIYECQEIFVSCYERHIFGDRLPIYSISLRCRHKHKPVSLLESYYAKEEADKALEAILENMKDGKVKI